MTHPVKSYAAFSATTPLAPYAFERRDLREDDVLIDILYCGVCAIQIYTLPETTGVLPTLTRLWSDTKSSDELPKSAKTPTNSKLATWWAWAVWSIRAVLARLVRTA